VADAVSVTITRNTLVKLKPLAQRFPIIVDQMIGVSIAEGAEIARQLCPVDEGDLKSTVRIERVRARLWKLKAGGIPGTATGKFVDYALYVEGGTIHQEAQPFIHPAMVEARKNLLRRLAQLESHL
jgi:hypothetical protein